MKPTRFRLGFWICLAISGIVLAEPAMAQADNVVPNRGFEIPGCSSSIICVWDSLGRSVFYRDTSQPHTGDASMHLWCGVFGCEPSFGYASLAAGTERAACAPLGPGTHAASFWYRTGYSEGVWLSMYAAYSQEPGCAGPWSGGFLSGQPIGDNSWHEMSGALRWHRPVRTRRSSASVWRRFATTIAPSSPASTTSSSRTRD
jgi:hypothetical protein